MGLRGALALVGVLVVFAVALNAYDRGRIRDRVRRLFEGRFAAPEAPDEAPSPPEPPPWSERRVLHAAPEAADEEPESDEEPFGAIDFLVFLPGETPVVRDAALGIYKQNEYVIDKPHRLYGRRVGARAWRNLAKDREDARYELLALALQLADRAGPVSEADLNAITQIGLKLADALDRPPRFNMSFEEGLERAQALDKFCSAFDVIASIHVVADSVPVFRGPAIERAAQEVHMEFGARNIFHRKSGESDGRPNLYSLANQFHPGSFDPLRLDSLQTQGLTLFMSVPCTPDPVATFTDMVRDARVIARRLGGKLQDADRRVLTEAGLRAITKQIASIAERMAHQGITPGTLNAMRLFPP